MDENALYIGIDVGTGGVRCLAVDADGEIHGEGRRSFACENTATGVGRSEQSPADWLAAADAAMRDLFSQIDGELVAGIAVDGTSGTILAVDQAGAPLSSGIMHNDVRAVAESADCSEIFGQAMSPTFGLPKALWLLNHADLPAGARFLHQADYVNEWLCQRRVATDFTNAMKSGIDLMTLDWSEAMDRTGLKRTQWPEICKPGQRLGLLGQDRARAWGLSSQPRVFAGATDSNAAFYASGAAVAGDWNTTIGTTLAVKGISVDPVSDPSGRVYNHRHPDLAWLPGGASNGGGEMLRKWFADEDFAELDRLAHAMGQTDHVVYPSVRKGERLPIADPTFEPFVKGDRADRVGFYLGCLEGTAFLERRTYDVLSELGAKVGGIIYATGGAAKSPVWLQLRANVLNRKLAVPKSAESAMGAAILAAAGATGLSVGVMAQQMVRIVSVYEPDADAAQVAYYDEKYQQFSDLIIQHGN